MPGQELILSGRSQGENSMVEEDRSNDTPDWINHWNLGTNLINLTRKKLEILNEIDWLGR
jgi:hypothetical protein